MKRLLLSLAIGLGAVASTSAMAATPAFSAQKAAQVKVPDLSFKQVMRALYSGQMSNVLLVNTDDIDSLPHVGLGDVDKEGLRTLALMHPVTEYHNLSGDTRYLVTIEKVKIYDRNGNLVSCRACKASADLYTFKRLDTGVFQLVSKSLPKTPFSSTWGRILFDLPSISVGMQPIGKNIVGSVYKNSESGFGQIASWWEILHLPEDDYINIYELGNAGEDTSGYYGDDSPLSYSYDVAYKVLPDNSQYYPFKMTFIGDKPNESNGRIEYVNHSVIKKFNPAKKEYQ